MYGERTVALIVGSDGWRCGCGLSGCLDLTRLPVVARSLGCLGLSGVSVSPVSGGSLALSRFPVGLSLRDNGM